jgi:hypothetical protein
MVNDIKNLQAQAAELAVQLDAAIEKQREDEANFHLQVKKIGFYAAIAEVFHLVHTDKSTPYREPNGSHRSQADIALGIFHKNPTKAFYAKEMYHLMVMDGMVSKSENHYSSIHQVFNTLVRRGKIEKANSGGYKLKIS